MVAEIKVGDSIPHYELQDGSPFEKVDIADALKSGKGLIVSTPAAFSPDCTDSHVPGYVLSEKLKDAGNVFVIAVDNGFVMKAWSKKLDAEGKTGIRFLGDPSGEFIKQLGVDWDSEGFFGNRRGKRGAIATLDGKVTKVFFEPDNFGISESAADKFLE